MDACDLAAVSVSVINVYDLVLISLSGRVELAEALRRNLVERALQASLVAHRQFASQHLVICSLDTAIQHRGKGVLLLEYHPLC